MNLQKADFRAFISCRRIGLVASLPRAVGWLSSVPGELPFIMRFIENHIMGVYGLGPSKWLADVSKMANQWTAHVMAK